MRLTVLLAAQLFLTAVFPAVAQDEQAVAKNKMAEIVALIRVGRTVCPEVSDVWVIEALGLYATLKEQAPSEETIAAKQASLNGLREKFGRVKRCYLYAVELEQAHLVAERIIQGH